MIVVVGRVRTDSSKREDLVRIGTAVAAASREEEGCIAYRLYEAADVPNEFVFVEEWRDDAALQAHFKTPHIAEFLAAIPNAIEWPPDVKFHEVAGSRDLAEVGAAGPNR
jgi:quinol monooxygenase YgiN